jgi:hypothetical protein
MNPPKTDHDQIANETPPVVATGGVVFFVEMG